MKISFRPFRSAIAKSAGVFQRMNAARERQGQRMARWVETKLHPRQTAPVIEPPVMQHATPIKRVRFVGISETSETSNSSDESSIYAHAAINWSDIAFNPAPSFHQIKTQLIIGSFSLIESIDELKSSLELQRPGTEAWRNTAQKLLDALGDVYLNVRIAKLRYEKLPNTDKNALKQLDDAMERVSSLVDQTLSQTKAYDKTISRVRFQDLHKASGDSSTSDDSDPSEVSSLVSTSSSESSLV